MSKVVFFTDGAASMKKIGNQYVRQAGGWAWVRVIDDKTSDFDSGGEKSTSNNRMELMAIYEALKNFKKEYSQFDECVIYSDSAYSINVITQWSKTWARNGWTKKGGEIQNLELIKEIYNLVNEFPNLSFIKVKGHAGDKWNELVDNLAVQAKKQQE